MDRAAVIREMDDLHRTEIAEHEEVMGLIERHDLHGRGIGYVDAHLLASALLTPGAHLWTRERRPHAAAEHLSVAARDEET